MSERNRRKPVACVLCGQQTYERSAVCPTCTENAKMGEKVRANQSEDGTENVSVYLCLARWQVVSADQEIIEKHLSEHWRRIDYSLVERVFDKAVGLVEIERYFGFGIATGEQKTIGWNGKDHNSRARRCTLPAGRAAAVDELATAIRLYAKSCYDEGYADGQRLLVKIATGELTVEQMEVKKGK